MNTTYGWPASSEPFAFSTLFSCVSGIFYVYRCIFPKNRSTEKGPKTEKCHVCSGPLLMNMLSLWKNSQNNRILTCFTSTHIHARDSTSMHHSLVFFKSQVFTSSLRALWSALQSNFSPSRRWQTKASAARRSPRRVFFLSSTEMADRIVTLKDAAQKHVI